MLTISPALAFSASIKRLHKTVVPRGELVYGISDGPLDGTILAVTLPGAHGAGSHSYPYAARPYRHLSSQDTLSGCRINQNEYQVAIITPETWYHTNGKTSDRKKDLRQIKTGSVQYFYLDKQGNILSRYRSDIVNGHLQYRNPTWHDFSAFQKMVQDAVIPKSLRQLLKNMVSRGNKSIAQRLSNQPKKLRYAFTSLPVDRRQQPGVPSPKGVPRG